MKAILMSVQPKWLEKILNGEKTIEIRKTMPKCELPIDVYLYCTRPKERWSVGCMVFYNDELYKLPSGEIKYGSSIELMAYDNCTRDNFLNGKIVAKYIVGEVKPCFYDEMCFPDGYEDFDGNWVDRSVVCGKQYYITCEELEKSCLTYDELENYGKGKPLYLNEITNLVIFDKPKELGEFYKVKTTELKADITKPRNFDNANGFQLEYIPITKAPQSWMYCEVENE